MARQNGGLTRRVRVDSTNNYASNLIEFFHTQADIAVTLKNSISSDDCEKGFNLITALQNIATNNSSTAHDILLPFQTIIASLEALTKIHPFVAVAVLPFKAVVTLEFNRRENDRRILALISQMADMMNCFRDLPSESVKAQDQGTLEELLLSIRVSEAFGIIRTWGSEN